MLRRRQVEHEIVRGAECGAQRKFLVYSLESNGLTEFVAETEGFEPSVGEYPLRRFSKPLVSATHPRLRIAAERGL